MLNLRRNSHIQLRDQELEQENYSLTQKLQVKSKTEQCQTGEIERLERELRLAKDNAADVNNQLAGDKKLAEQLLLKVRSYEMHTYRVRADTCSDQLITRNRQHECQ